MLKSLFILLVVWKSTTALICYTCENEPSFDACAKRGGMRRCQVNEKTCHTEVIRFMRPQGVVYSISKRCKQADACDNNQIQNPRAAWKPSQCNLNFPSSVCRCCCNSDKCNFGGFYCVVGPSCSRIPVIEQNGLTKCTLGRNQESVCTNSCDPGYELIGEPKFGCHRHGGKLSWNITRPAACIKTTCNEDALKIKDGFATCTNGNKRGSICEFSCIEGYTLQNGWPVTSCNTPDNITNVIWDSDIPTCERTTCLDLKAPENGFLICSNDNRIGSKCKTRCHRGYEISIKSKSVCGLNNNMLPPVWTNEAPPCEVATCHPPLLPPMNGSISCTSGNKYNSVCTVKCDRGFRYDGEPIIGCGSQEKRKRKIVWNGTIATCTKMSCAFEQVDPRNGAVTCSNKNIHGSVCKFTCQDGFKIKGSSEVYCGGFANPVWSVVAPTCEAHTCSGVSISNGQVDCTDAYRVGSACSFVCDDGYKLIGKKTVTCNQDGDGPSWSDPSPQCQKMRCSSVSAPANGNMECTNGMLTGSACSFSCSEPYELNPDTSGVLTCLQNETWDQPAPCCLGSCPPNAYVDLIMIIDSSSSIGSSNFQLIRNFVKSIVREFTIGNENTKFGIFRYNSMVDSQSEITLNSYNSVGELIQKIDRIPYNGVGTMTGKALQHAVSYSLHSSNGNRPEAPDGVLLITDGVTNVGDDFITPTKELRDRNVGVFGAFIPPADKDKTELGIKQLEFITGSPNNVVLVREGFSALMSIHSPVDKFVCKRECTVN